MSLDRADIFKKRPVSMVVNNKSKDDTSPPRPRSAKISDETPESCKRYHPEASLSRSGKWLSQGFYEHKQARKKPGIKHISATIKPEEAMKGFGKHAFRGAIAAPYLKRAGLPDNALDTPFWMTDGSADKVAAAVLEWAKENGAYHYCHWFQPLGAAGVRHGQTGQVQNSLCEFDSNGIPVWEFKGKQLLRGETDGSSYPNGGLRTTNAAGGYLAIDPTSPIFLRSDAIFIPAAFVSYKGHALDEKTPLLRASDALSREAVRLLGLLGYKVNSVGMQMGFELELFFVERECYMERPDLQLCGRTIMGKPAPRGQQLHDHYMAPVSLVSPVMACMQEIQQQCFKMGIPLKTRHREVAPNQYEFSPMYGPCGIRVDQNLVVMQIVEEVAVCYGLTALFHEKPFDDVNGSGKHNNWSLSTDDGTNIFNVARLAKKVRSREIFPVIMAALVQAVDQHGDLLQLAVSTPGNELRLGGWEAPSSIACIYLGASLTEFLEGYMNGVPDAYAPMSRFFDMGASALPPIEVPVEDRNRTSFFAYGGHRFEFRATGSSQNLSMVNTVLATICAKVFKEFADAIADGETARTVAMESLKKHFKCIFNGDGYSHTNQKMLIERGLWTIDSSIEAICRFTADKNIYLFEEMKVFTEMECKARENVLLTQYIGTVEIEAGCMLDMINQKVIPSMIKAEMPEQVKDLEKVVLQLAAGLEAVHHEQGGLKKKAELSQKLRLKIMPAARTVCDDAEAVCPVDMWAMCPYRRLLFIDQNHNPKFIKASSL